MNIDSIYIASVCSLLYTCFPYSWILFRMCDCSQDSMDQVQIFQILQEDLLQLLFLPNLVQLPLLIILVGNICSIFNFVITMMHDKFNNHWEKIFPSVIGTIQGLHNIHGSFNIPNMPGSLASRNSTINGGHPGGIQQPAGSLSNGRFPINHLPTALSQVWFWRFERCAA